jgi:hypothetical protein
MNLSLSEQPKMTEPQLIQSKPTDGVVEIARNHGNLNQAQLADISNFAQMRGRSLEANANEYGYTIQSSLHQHMLYDNVRIEVTQKAAEFKASGVPNPVAAATQWFLSPSVNSDGSKGPSPESQMMTRMVESQRNRPQ